MTGEVDAPLRKGPEPYGRFGTCVSAIGDIDNDNFQGTVQQHLDLFAFILIHNFPA